MSEKTLSILGGIATIAGVGLSLLSGWIGKKQQNNLIEKLVSEKVNQLTNK